MDERPDDELPWKPARPDAACAYHPQREALVRCPMCDHDVCFGCFFPDYGRCQRCVEAHPDEIAEPVPFEAPNVSFVRGFAKTLANAFSPRLTAPSFALGEGALRPVLFFLFTYAPLAFLRGIIPYTHRVHFGSLGAVVVTPGTNRGALIADVVRAGGLSLLEVSVELGALAACYVSLAGAFGRPEIRRIAARALAYRAFLLPLGGLLGLLPMLLAWLGPRGAASVEAMLLVGALPTVPLFLALHRTVRTVGRVDALAGLAVALVPWLLVGAVALLLENVMAPLVPAVETAESAQVTGGS